MSEQGRRAMSVKCAFQVVLASWCLEAAAGFDGLWRKTFPPWNETGTLTDQSPVVHFPLLGPFTGHSCFPSRYMSMRIATSHVNRRDAALCPAISDLSEDFELSYEMVDTTGNHIGAVSALVTKFVEQLLSGLVKIVLGPNSSGESASTSSLLSVYDVPQVGFAATSASLSNKANFPNVFRVTSPDSIVMTVLAGFIASLGWKEVAMIFFDAPFQAGQASDFDQAAQTEDLLLFSFPLPNSGEGGQAVNARNQVLMYRALAAVERAAVRVILGIAIGEEAWDLWHAAHSRGMYGGEDPERVWIGTDGIQGQQLLGDPKRLEMFAGTLFITVDANTQEFGRFKELWRAEMPTTEVPEFEEDLCRSSQNNIQGSSCIGHPDFIGWEIGHHDVELFCETYTALAYDAVVLIAVVADRLIKNTGKHPSELTSQDWMAEMKELSNAEKSFSCLTGPVVLDENQDRRLPMAIWNWHNDSFVATKVATWDPRVGAFPWTVNSTIVWPSGRWEMINSTDGPARIPRGSVALDCEMGSTLDLAVPQCVPCEPGYHKATVGPEECSPCEVGWFAKEPGQDLCERCSLGTYQTGTAASACLSCDDDFPGSTTNFLGAVSNESCLCPSGTYWKEVGAGFFCKLCTEGLECDLGRSEPQQVSGYHVDILGDPARRDYSIYQCAKEKQCPAGRVGVCAGGASGLVCNLCPHGESWDDERGACESCDAVWAWAKFLFVCAGVVLLVGALHRHATTGDENDAVTSITEVVVTVGSLITLLQIAAVIGQLRIELGFPLDLVLNSAKWVALDIGSLSLGCSLGWDWTGLYTAVSIFPLMVVAVYGAVLVAFCKTFADRDGHKATLVRYANTLGTVFNACYIILLIHGSRAFISYKHPNGRRSLTFAPDVFTDEAEYKVIMAVAIVHLLAYGVGFLLLCSCIVFKMRRTHRTPLAPLNLMRWCRFFYYKFRPSRYYWMLVQVLRSVALNFVPILVDDTLTELMLLQVIVIIYLMLQSLAWPYRTPAHNVLDTLAHIAVLLVVSAASNAVPHDGGTLSAAISYLALIPVFTFVVVFFIVVGRIAKGGLFRMMLTEEEWAKEHAARVSEHQAREQSYISSVLGVDATQPSNSVLMAEDAFVPNVSEIVGWKPRLRVDALIILPAVVATSRSILQPAGNSDRSMTPGAAAAAAAARMSQISLLLPKEHACTKLPIEAVNILEGKIRFRALTWRSQIPEDLDERVEQMLRRSNHPPSWTQHEQEQLTDLSEHLTWFFNEYAHALTDDATAMQMLETYVDRWLGEFRGVFSACTRDVLRLDPHYKKALDEGNKLRRAAEERGHDDVRWPDSTVSLLAQAAMQQEILNSYAAKLASGLGRCNPGVMKGLFRTLEKRVFEGKTEEPVKSWDSSRVLVVFHSMGSIAEACKRLMFDHKIGKIRLLRVKERFTTPTGGGWSDILVNLQFNHPDGCEHESCAPLPNEIQLAHFKLMIIRKELGAHNTYAKVRGAEEIVEFAKTHKKALRQASNSHEIAISQAAEHVPSFQEKPEEEQDDAKEEQSAAEHVPSFPEKPEEEQDDAKEEQSAAEHVPTFQEKPEEEQDAREEQVAAEHVPSFQKKPEVEQDDAKEEQSAAEHVPSFQEKPEEEQDDAKEEQSQFDEFVVVQEGDDYSVGPVSSQSGGGGSRRASSILPVSLGVLSDHSITHQGP